MLELDVKDLEKLAAMHCTYNEIAAFFGVSQPTVKRRMTEDKYREAYERGQGKGQISLRRTQFRLAETHAGMAIFLGKNYLGQSDKLVHEGGEVPFIFKMNFGPSP